MLTTPIIKFHGNSVQCHKWLGFARVKLNALVASMAEAKLDQNRGTIYPVPGVIVNFSKSFNTTRINIVVAAGISGEAERFYQWYWYTLVTGGTIQFFGDVAIANATQDVWCCGMYSDIDPPTSTYGEKALLVRHDTDGLLLASKTLVQQTEREEMRTVTIGSDNSLYIQLDLYSANNPDPIPVGNYATADGALIKLTSSGIVQWSKKYGLMDTAVQNYDTRLGTIVVSGEKIDSLFVGGWINDWSLTQPPANQINGTRWVAFLHKYASDGTRTWTRILYYDYVAGGGSLGLVSGGNLKIWRVALDSINNCYCSGLDTGDVNYINAGGGWGQGSIIKFDMDGTKQWHKQIYSVVDFPSTDQFWVVDIDVDSEDNLYALVVHSDPTDGTYGNFIFYLIKLDPSSPYYVGGQIDWQQSITVPYSGGVGNWNILFPTNPRMAIGPNDDVYIFTNAYDSVEDAIHLLFKFDSDGDLVWQRTMASTRFGLDLGRITIDSDDDILITGDDQVTRAGFTIKLPGSGSFAGTHQDMVFTEPELVIESPDGISTGVSIREADSVQDVEDGPLLKIGSTFFNYWDGTYETENITIIGAGSDGEDISLSGETNKILETERLR